MYQDLGDANTGVSKDQIAVDARELLERLGANSMQVLLITRYLFMTPLTVDPDMQGVQELVKLIQRGLNKLGARLRVDGTLGADTAAALNKVTPPKNSYASKSWLRIVNDLVYAIRSGKRPLGDEPPLPGGGTLQTTSPGGSSFFRSPFVMAGLVLLGGALIFGKKRRR